MSHETEGLPPPSILWCCHVRGPDDVHPAPNYDIALAWSDFMNDRFGPHTRKHENDPIIRAAPAIWPWSTEAHAAGLVQAIKEFTPRDGSALSSTHKTET